MTVGLRDMLRAIRRHPAAHDRLETAERDLRQTRTALEKSELERQRLSGSCSEARRRLRFAEKNAEALQAALAEFCPKLDSLESMLRFYEKISPSLDSQGFTLYRTAKKITKTLFAVRLSCPVPALQKTPEIHWFSGVVRSLFVCSRQD